MLDENPTPPLAPQASPSPLARFTYHGAQTGAAFDFGTAAAPDVLDILLRPGREVELPASDQHVAVLVELGHLKPIAPAGKAPVTTKKKGQ